MHQTDVRIQSSVPRLVLHYIIPACCLLLASCASKSEPSASSPPSAANSRGTYRNPIIGAPGAADPDVLLYKGKYYLYPTLDGRGYDVFVSDGLVHWERKPKCFTDPRGGAWAPDFFYNEKGDGAIYLYYTLSHADGGKMIGVARATDPLGP